ncbi:TetR/AcrR family transcriptional regulator [Sphingobium tyrosinilyticum]|uniref:TetR/AcrR family transcriptional regulator n=1 Tax=Sphingobium tyrosinilyticum TaxID=2715436 RepID=A0ABV9F1A3_9SPHN
MSDGRLMLNLQTNGRDIACDRAKGGGMVKSVSAKISGQGRGEPGMVRRTQKQRSEGTRAALIDAARCYFGQHGFHATRTSEFVAEAEVTRGALYHHFTDKEGLFDAVVCHVAEDISRRARQEVLARSSVQETVVRAWDRLLLAFDVYLRAVAEDREVQRILLIDAPAVLGWSRWREIQSEVFMPGTMSTLHRLMELGAIHKTAPEPLAQLILAATNDAALAIAHADDPALTLESHSHALMTLVSGLSISGGQTLSHSV